MFGLKKEIKLYRKIRDFDLPEINSLICSFEWEIDSNPEEWNIECQIVDSLLSRNKDWRKLMVEELISVTNSMFSSMNRFEDFRPITVNFNFLASLFYSPRFGIKIKIKWN